MNLRDYLIDQAGKDWAQLLCDWAPPLPLSFTLWLVNRFGDAFVVTEDGAVSMLDVGAGNLALHVGDDPADVGRRRRELRAVGGQP